MPASCQPDSEAMPDMRLEVSGKFLRQGGKKVYLRGVSYGPFKINSLGDPFPESTQLCLDLAHIHELGFDCIRLYHPPSDLILSEARRLGLKLIVGIPWTDHVDFLRTRRQRLEIIEHIRNEGSRLRGHPCIAAFIIGNEIEKTLVRWMRPQRVQRFLERLIAEGRACAPQHLFCYATYPSTEYLMPRNADFLALNVYLEKPEALAAYLQRLQNLAGNKPLVISEFGLDVARQGEESQAKARRWFDQSCRDAAVAGTVWFSYTDEWQRSGVAVTEWKFGIVDAQRRERPSARLEYLDADVQREKLRFSVIVCTFNGGATLHACLESLQHLNDAEYEVLVVDDGSTEDMAAILRAFPTVRYLRQVHAGLSAARNLGAAEANGEILAYLDDDCLADEDWLKHLERGFDEPAWVACGGPNIPPKPRNKLEAIVACAPGAPAHVLLSDIEAEHLPGCNLAIRKTALLAIGGFREVYRTAGDDVDVCWRLREAGGRLRFVPGAMVWHHRRHALRAYLRQQFGYGKAEALLMRDHPQHFGLTGGARWRGAIYGDLPPSADPASGRIFHGAFGNGLFQGIYQDTASCHWDGFSGLLWLALFTLALAFGLWILAGLLLTLSIYAARCRMLHLATHQHDFSWLDQLKLLALCWVQPLLREYARLPGKWNMFSSCRLGADDMDSVGSKELPRQLRWREQIAELFRSPSLRIPLGEWAFWSQDGVGREALLECLKCTTFSKRIKLMSDADWQHSDLTSGCMSYLTVSEEHGNHQRLTRIRALLTLDFFAVIFGVVVIGALIWLSNKLGLPLYIALPLIAVVCLRWHFGRKVIRSALSCGMVQYTSPQE